MKKIRRLCLLYNIFYNDIGVDLDTKKIIEAFQILSQEKNIDKDNKEEYLQLKRIWNLLFKSEHVSTIITEGLLILSATHSVDTRIF